MDQKVFVDYYKLLGLKPDAATGQIRAAYLQCAKIHHPDVGGSAREMRLYNEAYKTLANQSAKAAYDMIHGYHTGETKPSDYKYSDGRAVNSVDDMNDFEIDMFVDSLWAEYKNAPKRSPKVKAAAHIKTFIASRIFKNKLAS